MRTKIYELIDQERDSQQSKYGERNKGYPALGPKRMAILGEEFGEACATQDALDNTTDPDLVRMYIQNYIDELVQIAALAVQDIEKIWEEYPEFSE